MVLSLEMEVIIIEGRERGIGEEVEEAPLPLRKDLKLWNWTQESN